MGIEHRCHRGINRPKREAHSLSYKVECLEPKLDFHYTSLCLCASATGKKLPLIGGTYRDDEKTLQIINELHGVGYLLKRSDTCSYGK
jgi:hypothetical protein